MDYNKLADILQQLPPSFTNGVAKRYRVLYENKRRKGGDSLVIDTVDTVIEAMIIEAIYPPMPSMPSINNRESE